MSIDQEEYEGLIQNLHDDYAEKETVMKDTLEELYKCLQVSFVNMKDSTSDEKVKVVDGLNKCRDSIDLINTGYIERKRRVEDLEDEVSSLRSRMYALKEAFTIINDFDRIPV